MLFEYSAGARWREILKFINLLNMATESSNENVFTDDVHNKVSYVNSLEDALDIVKDYELRTTTKFTVYKKSKAFGATGMLIHIQFKHTSHVINLQKYA